MNKKIISRILLGSVLTVSLGAFAVSCHSEPTSNELNDEANKVTIDYPSKDMILSKDTAEKSFVFSGYNDKKFKISLISVMPNDRDGQAIIDFKLVYLFNENKQSDTKKMTISGFKSTTKELSSIAEKIKIDYPKKEDVYPWDSTSNDFITMDVPENVVVSDIKVTGYNLKESKSEVTFSISYKNDLASQINHSLEISGFKEPEKNSSNLTKTFFENNAEYTQWDLTDKSKVLNLLKELYKADGEIVVDFTNGKLLIPKNGKSINLLNPETFVEVGSIKVAALHNQILAEAIKLFHSSFIVGNFNLFDFIYKLFTSSKEKALYDFKKQMPDIINAKKELHNAYFSEDFNEIIEKLLEKEDFSIVFNPKTGYFVSQIYDVDIDLTKSKTYKNLIGVDAGFVGLLVERIQNMLVKNKIHRHSADWLFFDYNFSVEYIIQKKSTNVMMALKIKQINKNL